MTVVVLNTCRNPNIKEGKGEPIASGPLVAKWLAQWLGNLTWIDGQGQVPNIIQEKTSTWVDILVNNEAAEDQNVQQKIVKRLINVFKAWSLGIKMDKDR